MASGTEVIHPEYAMGEKVTYKHLPKKFVAGTVIYGDLDEVAAGVDVVLAGADGARTMKTNGFGDFEFEELAEAATYTVTIEVPGYAPATPDGHDQQGRLPRRDRAGEVGRRMPGITAYGAYIPLHRLSRAEIARAWGARPAPGERAVAGYDEDSLTMAVAAARDCLKGADRGSVGGLYFASTTAPYKEKQAAATIASVLELPPHAVTMDFGGSLRCGTNALKAALDAVASGSATSVLVCAADMRLGYPSGPGEMNFGDGAVALLVGAGDVLAEVKHFDSRYYEIQDTWRSDRDTFVRTAEDRFSMDEGYVDVMVHGVAAALERYGLAAADVAHVALNSPNARQLQDHRQEAALRRADPGRATSCTRRWATRAARRA